VNEEGTHVRFPAITVQPRPRSRPHPPMYLVCRARPTVELAARYGLPMILSFAAKDEARAAQLALLQGSLRWATDTIPSTSRMRAR